MPNKSPDNEIIRVVISPQLRTAIARYRRRKGILTESEAVRQLLALGLQHAARP